MNEQDTRVADETDYLGTVMHVSWGSEHIQLVRFMGMTVGPFAMDVVIQMGESPGDAKRRAMVHLNAMAEEEYKLKTPVFIERCREAEKNL